MKRTIIAAALLALTGCTAIGHKPPPADWPKLTVSEHKVGFWELQKICGSLGGGLITQHFGCAWIYFHNMTCEIYYASDDEYGVMVLEHEREHCKGKDHYGASTMADAWTDWKKDNQNVQR